MDNGKEYYNKLLDLAYEFRDDPKTCIPNCLECPLGRVLSDSMGQKITPCQFMIAMLNDNAEDIYD